MKKITYRPKIYLFLYGTLKSNHYNHPRFNLDDPTNGHVVCRASVQNFGIKVLEGLPRAIRCRKGSEMYGEVYEVNSPHLFQRLCNMELNSGYYIEHVIATSEENGATYECLMFASDEVYGEFIYEF